MRHAFQEQFEILANRLDQADRECLLLEKRVNAGETLTSTEFRQHRQWVNEGRPLWRGKWRAIRRLRKTARMCVRNARRKR